MAGATEGGRCCCCLGTSSKAHLRGLLACQQCGHVRANLEIGTEELERIYSASYFLGEEYQDYAREERALNRNFESRLRGIRRRAAGGNLWEIGCAYGFFLRIAARHYAASGCDISRHAVQKAREEYQCDARLGDYLSFPAPERPWDAVCLWDTIEHLAAPESYLEKAAAELRPGGLIALSTGDIGAILPRLQGERWRLIHPPSHLHYFTCRSMTTLLERLGFENIEIRHHPFWRSADAVAYRLLGYPEDRKTAPVYRLLKKTGVLGLLFPINTWDLMTVYATRRQER